MASQAAELKMPQSGNVPREPSMEEILASIRRIIEDSDQGRKPEQELESVAPADAAAPAADVHAFREEFGGAADGVGAESMCYREDGPVAKAEVASAEPEFDAVLRGNRGTVGRGAGRGGANGLPARAGTFRQ